KVRLVPVKLASTYESLLRRSSYKSSAGWGAGGGGRAGAPEGRALRPESLLEAFERPRFAVKGLKNGQQLGDHKQVLNFLGQVQEFELAALVVGRSVGADELADSRAVDISHFAKVKQDLFLPVVKQPPDGFSQLHAALAYGYLA